MAHGNVKMSADEKIVSDLYRKHYIRTKSKTDAWNATLLELAGPYKQTASAAELQRRKGITDILRRVADRPMSSSVRGKAGTGTVTLSVHPLDVWGNRHDGWQVNDVYPSRGTITIPKDAGNAEIVMALKREGFIDRNIHHKSVGIEGEVEYGLHIEDKFGKPAYELRVVSR